MCEQDIVAVAWSPTKPSLVMMLNSRSTLIVFDVGGQMCQTAMSCSLDSSKESKTAVAVSASSLLARLQHDMCEQHCTMQHTAACVPESLVAVPCLPAKASSFLLLTCLMLPEHIAVCSLPCDMLCINADDASALQVPKRYSATRQADDHCCFWRGTY